MRKFLFLVVTLLILFGAAYGAFVVEVPIGPESATLVNFPPGTTTSQISATLLKKGIIRSRLAFLVLHYLQGTSIKAGEYRFTQPATLRTVYGRLRRGDVYTISVTIPEGDNLFDIANRLAAAHLTTRAAFLQVAEHDTSLVKAIDPQAPSLEGYLFPDTYKFTPGISAEEMAATMVHQFVAEAARLGLGTPVSVPAAAQTQAQTQAQAPAQAQAGTQASPQADGTQLSTPPSLHEIVTIASLIERETPIPSERPLVASVFYNRLRKDMPLMTDPSVIYAAILQNNYHGVVYESDLKSGSPYNTYTHLGLPPGPICNPGLGSLRAAIHPATTDYLYFVAATANPSGHSRFSATLAQHDKNVAAYRKAIREASHN